MGDYVVIDLEMCRVPKNRRTREFHWSSEIIQIGAVRLNQDYEVVDEFSTYVSPRLGFLTPEISNLTGISARDLIGAPDIKVALDQLEAWLPDEPILVSWSDTDRYQISYEVTGKALTDISLLEYEWVDCQKIFDNKIDAVYCYSLTNALNLSDIDYREGIHNGLVDAYNTALLFKKLKMDPDYKFNRYYQSIIDDPKDEPVHLSASLGQVLSGMSLNLAVV